MQAVMAGSPHLNRAKRHRKESSPQHPIKKNDDRTRYMHENKQNIDKMSWQLSDIYV
jgi:hypothetical protein